MRILASNPDTIGDLVLRQPLYASLLAAGHELMLVVRSMLIPLVGQVAPGARAMAIETEVYDSSVEPDSAAFDALAAAAREFRPDVFLVAPFQWTVLEERLAAELPGVRCVAMTGRVYSDPSFGPERLSRLCPTERVEVTEDMPEPRKNEKLATQVLGRDVRLPDPALKVSAAQSRAAEAELVKLGLSPGGYWVACVGHSKHTAVRDWVPDRWARVLSQWPERSRRFLLIGSEPERESLRAVRARMGDADGVAVEWVGEGESSVETLVGLVAASAGYVGRDTGPMHIAAALGKPVLAVFGGGTWPRFLPQVNPSIAITVGVPCVGCGWRCHLESSYCIKDVPAKDVLAAAEELEEGKVRGREARVIPPTPLLLTQIGREGAVAARRNLAEASRLRREADGSESVRSELEARAARLAAELASLSDELRAARARLDQQGAVAAQYREQLAAAARALGEKEAGWSRHVASLDKLMAELRAEHAEALVKRGEDAGALAAARERLAEAIPVLDDLRGRLGAAQHRLGHAESQASDLRLRVTRLEADQTAVSALARQHEAEVEVLRLRLSELLASRWRKLGQKMGVAMKLPWERDSGANGQGH
jgi:ADP-heptose:LPS heptosyltransferase/predicted  nucleic acid-binding Zn-ribbon protein